VVHADVTDATEDENRDRGSGVSVGAILSDRPNNQEPGTREPDGAAGNALQRVYFQNFRHE